MPGTLIAVAPGDCLSRSPLISGGELAKHIDPAPTSTMALPTSVRNNVSARDVVLPIWDQIAMRSYMRCAFCFPLEGATTEAALEHIRLSLARLSRQRPDFAAAIEVRDDPSRTGVVHLCFRDGDDIPFEVVDVANGDDESVMAEDWWAGGRTYEDLKAAEFPPQAFVHPRFKGPITTARVPVAQVTAYLVPGGLILAVFLHHSFADGECMKVFIETLAGQTRGEPVMGHPDCLKDPVLCDAGARDHESIEGSDEVDVEEYTLTSEPCAGPTSPCLEPGGVPISEIEKTGKIFVFRLDKLAELRTKLAEYLAEAGSTNNGHINGANNCHNGAHNGSHNSKGTSTYPTIYTCIATLSWIHATRARHLDPHTYTSGKAPVETTRARLQTMVNWKARAFRPVSDKYFGNATSIAITGAPLADVLQAGSRAETSDKTLAAITAQVARTISSVDDEFVAKRARLLSRVRDFRTVGLRFDPRTEHDLGFNTWRWFGADSVWVIPGVNGGRGTKADAVRRPQDMWNMSGAVIMPAREGSECLELLVTLPKTSMEVLCQDEGWLRWVERVVG